jgi:hypothetical protein
VTDRPTLIGGEDALDSLDLWGNLHASADYLRNLTRVLVRRALARATP